jgi:hypothetical protein
VINLLGGAKWVFLVMAAVFVLSLGAGLAAGKLKLADFQSIRNSRLVQVNRTLGARLLPVLLSEFGGYFLVITASLCLWAWAVRPRAFGFASRKEAVGKGFKFVGAMWLASGVFIALGAFFEVRFLLGMMK